MGKKKLVVIAWLFSCTAETSLFPEDNGWTENFWVSICKHLQRFKTRSLALSLRLKVKAIIWQRTCRPSRILSPSGPISSKKFTAGPQSVSQRVLWFSRWLKFKQLRSTEWLTKCLTGIHNFRRLITSTQKKKKVGLKKSFWIKKLDIWLR